MTISLHEVLLNLNYHPVQGISSPENPPKWGLLSIDYAKSVLKNIEKMQKQEIENFIPIPHELVPEVTGLKGDYIGYVSYNGKKESKEKE